MITFTMTFSLTPEAKEKMLPEFEKMCKASEAEEGCQTFRIYADMFDDSIIRLYEEFDSEEAVRFHRQTSHFKEILEAFGLLPDGAMTVHSQRWSESTPIEID